MAVHDHIIHGICNLQVNFASGNSFQNQGFRRSLTARIFPPVNTPDWRIFFASVMIAVAMIATDLKTGTIFKENGFPFVVLKYEHIKSARGGANVKVRARNLMSGQVLEKGYLASSKVEDADVRRHNAQYLYKEGETFYFMDPETYEQISINGDVIGDSAQFLKEGEKVQVMYFEDSPVSVELPITMIFEVTYTEPGFKGNTVSNVYKDATLDIGAVVKVPTFVKIGDKVKIDTRNGDYISKA